MRIYVKNFKIINQTSSQVKQVQSHVGVLVKYHVTGIIHDQKLHWYRLGLKGMFQKTFNCLSCSYNMSQC